MCCWWLVWTQTDFSQRMGVIYIDILSAGPPIRSPEWDVDTREFRYRQYHSLLRMSTAASNGTANTNAELS